jgi:alkylhydroperoxidase/carboxymuconolactone decarboxylase family protein YurZ
MKDRQLMTTNDSAMFPWEKFLVENSPLIAAEHLRWRRLRSSFAIDPKTAELIILALNVAVKWPEPYVDVHVTAAMQLGASVEELIEVVTITSLITGVHSMNHGVTAIERAIRNADE